MVLPSMDPIGVLSVRCYNVDINLLLMKCICAYCSKENDFPTGNVNRAKKMGLDIFCNRVCFGLSRRQYRSAEEKKATKAEYDSEYRKRNHVKERKRAWNKTPEGRKWQKINRERMKDNHLEYCRTPEYRAWKKEYDEKYVAKKNYGELWESAIITKRIEDLIAPEKYQIRIDKGTYNKSQKRKRQWNSLQQTLKKHYGTP